MASNCTYYVPKCRMTSLCDQNCGVQSADSQTDRNIDTQTHAWTDKKVKSEGPKILSNYIFYFKTVIVGGPISLHNLISVFPILSTDNLQEIDTSQVPGHLYRQNRHNVPRPKS